MTVKTSKGVTDWIELAEGLFQGETISSDLFISFIEDLKELINYELRGIAISEKREVQTL